VCESTKTKIKDFTELTLKTLLAIIGVLGLFILNNLNDEVKNLNSYIKSIDTRVKIIEFIHKADLKDFLTK
jgi:hypothetical protein